MIKKLSIFVVLAFIAFTSCTTSKMAVCPYYSVENGCDLEELRHIKLVRESNRDTLSRRHIHCHVHNKCMYIETYINSITPTRGRL